MTAPFADRFTHTRGRHLKVDGARLYVEEIGNPDGPALVLLHGGFGSSESFNAITPVLAPHYRLIGLDSRGQGMSTMTGDGTGGRDHMSATAATGTTAATGREHDTGRGNASQHVLSYARLQQDVQAVVQQLALSSYGVIGFSDGGILGLRLAATQGSSPGALRCVVSIGGHWQLADDDPTRPLFADISSSFWQTHFPDEYARYHALNPAPDFDALVSHIKALWLDDGPDGYPGEAVRQIAVPLLVVHGEDDPVVVRSNPLQLIERVPTARLLWLPFTGHAAHEERPDWLLPVLMAFLAQTRA